MYIYPVHILFTLTQAHVALPIQVYYQFAHIICVFTCHVHVFPIHHFLNSFYISSLYIMFIYIYISLIYIFLNIINTACSIHIMFYLYKRYFRADHLVLVYQFRGSSLGKIILSHSQHSLVVSSSSSRLNTPWDFFFYVSMSAGIIHVQILLRQPCRWDVVSLTFLAFLGNVISQQKFCSSGSLNLLSPHLKIFSEP